MGPFSHSFCAYIIIPQGQFTIPLCAQHSNELCILLNVSISGKEERKAGRKEWERERGKGKKGIREERSEKREKG